VLEIVSATTTLTFLFRKQIGNANIPFYREIKQTGTFILKISFRMKQSLSVADQNKKKQKKKNSRSILNKKNLLNSTSNVELCRVMSNNLKFFL